MKSLNLKRIGLIAGLPIGKGRMHSQEFRDRQIWKVLNRDGFKCAYCGTKEGLTLDHILPARIIRQRHGGDRKAPYWDCYLKKAQIVCVKCHEKKNIAEERLRAFQNA